MINQEIIKEWTKKNDYRKFGHGKDYKVVIIGEEHEIPQFIEQQEVLLSRLKPNYLLHEGFRACNYDPKTDRIGTLKKRAAHSSDIDHIIENNKYVINWAKEHNIPIIGCDISHNEFKKLAKSLVKKFPEKYREEPDPYEVNIDKVTTYNIRTGEMLGFEDRNVKLFRDEIIGKVIAEYASKAKKSLIAIIGLKHMAPKSPIHNILKKSKINYKCIYQTLP